MDDCDTASGFALSCGIVVINQHNISITGSKHAHQQVNISGCWHYEWGSMQGKQVKIVDPLGHKNPRIICVSAYSAGGHNAGTHNSCRSDKQYALHLMPSGVLNPKATEYYWKWAWCYLQVTLYKRRWSTVYKHLEGRLFTI